ncbi:MAG: DUF6367 family protein [Campylobacterota bacterium]|nr:DUF6367 family protein [Campylobacterota bacterium]
MSQVVLHHITKHIQGWIIDIHDSHGDKDYHQKHVHLIRNKLGGKYSWNIDGTRHDSFKFPSSEKWIEKARKLAANELKVEKDRLQFITSSAGKVNYKITTKYDDGINDSSKTYIRKNKVLIIFMTQNGLVSVISTLNRLEEIE